MSNLQQSYEEIKALWEQRDLSKAARIEQFAAFKKWVMEN